jgi:two-component system LytT family response regulator
MKAIIIDDEPLARDDLRYMLKKHSFIEIAGEAANVDESIALLSKVEADVVFLDIQLRGGSGFDLVPHIPPSAEIIFFTAYDEYAVRAFEVNALDYLLKPVTEDRLEASLLRLRDRIDNRPLHLDPSGSFHPDDQVFIKTDSEQGFIPVNAIVAVTSIGGNYTVVHLDNGKRHVVRRTLKEWKNILPASLFLPIHRMAIANIHRIDHIKKERDGSYCIYPAGQPHPFRVSRRRAALLLKGIPDRII